MLVQFIVAAMVLTLTCGAFAQATPSLVAGNPAPEFKVEKFLKGEEFKAFEKGKIYVVEFWATWCGPLVMNTRHLSRLQREYKAKGVTIAGVNVWEEDPYTEKALGTVIEFVREHGDAMDYSVAFDGASKHMDKNWVAASGRAGLPAAFVVDGAGIIAWIGHPLDLDMVLDEVVRGTWSITDGPKKIVAAAEAFEDAAAKYTEGLAAGDEAWKKAEAAYPRIAKLRRIARFSAMMNAKFTTEASALGNSIIDEAVAAKDMHPILGVIGAFMFPDSPLENYDKALFLKAARAIFDLSPEDYKRHSFMAQNYFTIGEIEKGRAEGAKAISMAGEEVKEPLKKWLDQQEAQAREAAAQPK